MTTFRAQYWKVSAAKLVGEWVAHGGTSNDPEGSSPLSGPFSCGK